MKTILVTAALIRDGNKVLISQRKPESHMGLKWEFPGGKLEEGESPENCLKREIKEELNLDISVGRIFEVISHRYAEKHIVMLCYEAFIREGEIKRVDCNDFCWVDKESLGKYDFAPADLSIVKRLLEEKF